MITPNGWPSYDPDIPNPEKRSVSEEPRPHDSEALFQWALRALGRKIHSTRELEVKLLARTDDASAVAGVLARLKASGYLDDRQCLETLVAVRLRRGDCSRSRLQREMAARGLPRRLVDQVLDEVFPPEKELAHLRHSLERKLEALSEPLDEKRLARLYNYLLGRGFPLEAVRREFRKRFHRLSELAD